MSRPTTHHPGASRSPHPARPSADRAPSRPGAADDDPTPFHQSWSDDPLPLEDSLQDHPDDDPAAGGASGVDDPGPDGDDLDDKSDPYDKYADYDWDPDDSGGPDRRSRRPAAGAGARLVVQGRSERRELDTAEAGLSAAEAEAEALLGIDRPRLVLADVSVAPTEVPYSSYDVATHGPDPVPEWVITSLSARDTRLGDLKSGKEADVTLLDRSLPGGPGCLLAVKTYRDTRHRMFHRDAGYQEGRRVRRSREGRAMAKRTQFGRDLLSGLWAGAEFTALSRLWQAGARVPYPVQMIGSELMMEFIGDPDGSAAPRLAAHDADTAEFTELWHDLVASLEILAEEGITHGDLSPYNVLVHDDRCVLIDLPQAVDVVANPQGIGFLERDCAIIADYFSRRGVRAADGELLALHLTGIARR